jgi:hypothetical protein
MMDEEVAEAAIQQLSEKTDRQLALLFAVNAFACALTGGKDSASVFARLHKAIVEEAKRRDLILKDRLH